MDKILELMRAMAAEEDATARMLHMTELQSEIDNIIASRVVLEEEVKALNDTVESQKVQLKDREDHARELFNRLGATNIQTPIDDEPIVEEISEENIENYFE